MVGNEVRSSFSSKVIPLSKTRKIRKSPFFAPKTEVFLLLCHRCFCCDADRADADRADTGPVAKEAGELRLPLLCLIPKEFDSSLSSHELIIAISAYAHYCH